MGLRSSNAQNGAAVGAAKWAGAASLQGKDPELEELERDSKADGASLLSHLHHQTFSRLCGTCLRAGRGDHWRSGGQGGDDVSAAGQDLERARTNLLANWSPQWTHL